MSANLSPVSSKPLNQQTDATNQVCPTRVRKKTPLKKGGTATPLVNGVAQVLKDAQTSKVALTQQRTPDQTISLLRARRALMGIESVPEMEITELVNRWVWFVLDAAMKGNTQRLNKELAFLDHAHIDNQQALLSAAHNIANELGHIETAQLAMTILHQKGFSLLSKPHFDRIKEADTTLIEARAKHELEIHYKSCFGITLIVLGTLGLAIPTAIDSVYKIPNSKFSYAAYSGLAGIGTTFCGIYSHVKNHFTLKSRIQEESDVSHYKIISRYIVRGDVEKAFNAFQERQWGNRGTGLLWEIGGEALKLGKLELAERIAQKMHWRDGSDEFLLKLARQYIEQGNLKKSLDVLIRMEAFVKMNDELERIAEKYLAKNDIVAVEAILDRITCPGTWLNLQSELVKKLQDKGDNERVCAILKKKRPNYTFFEF